jgi:peptidoglycan hydrolase-like protein with peptidoglycan-binding domain
MRFGTIESVPNDRLRSSALYKITWSLLMPDTLTLNKPVLRLGDSSPAVKELQNLLADYAKYIGSRTIVPGAADGIFSDKTLGAVMAFQEQVFLPRTGVVADLTWRSLFKRAPVDLPEVKFGESSEFVRILETRLVRLGYLREQANQVYTKSTVDAVNAFQKKAGLAQKSTVDEAMWFALSKVPIG